MFPVLLKQGHFVKGKFMDTLVMTYNAHCALNVNSTYGVSIVF